jgi:NAD(P)H dehydrogenase (quinone)
MKRILIIQGHPDEDSFCASAAKVYQNGAESKQAEVKLLQIGKMDFNPNLAFGYKKRTELEVDLIEAQKLIKWADHLVFVYPTWWGTMPALLKGFLDRTLLPGFGFKYRKDSLLWDKLLKGKTARLIVTMDTPIWYYYLIYRGAGHIIMKKGILNFCGINPVRISTLGPIKTSNNGKRTKWLQKIQRLGEQMM